MIMTTLNCFPRGSVCTYRIQICLKNYRRHEYSSWSIIETLLYSQRTRNLTICTNNNTHLQQPTRSSSSSNNNGSETTIQLPEPTWSVNSLELNKNHKPMEYNELKVLAKRAIIDLHYLSKTNKMSIDTLRQDVGNMMHMIQNITTTSNNKQQQNDDNSMTCQDIYDRPRGVTTAPIRATIPITQSKKNIDNNMIQVATNDTSVNNNFYHITNASCTSTDKQDNKKLWDQYIKPTKMKSVGGHYYFVIPTKMEKK